MVVLAPKIVTMDTKVFYYLFLCDTHMFSFSTKIFHIVTLTTYLLRFYLLFSQIICVMLYQNDQPVSCVKTGNVVSN